MTIADLAIPFFDLIVLGWIVEMRDIERGEKAQSWNDRIGIPHDMLKFVGI